MPPGEEKQLGQRVYKNGWRTGSALAASHVQEVAPYLQRAREEPRVVGEKDRLIVISQTCDLVAATIAQEPYVELLLATGKSKLDSTKANLRTTRYLSFRPRSNGLVLEARATDRFLVPRGSFADRTPDKGESLNETATRRLCDWLGLRYTRPAWPNNLVNRLPRDEVAEMLRRIALAVSEIWVAITDKDQELPEDKPYRLSIFAVMDAKTFDENAATREECAKAIQEFADLLRRCPGIIVDEVDLVSGDKFSWELMRMCDLWNLANLTAEATWS